MLSARRIPRRAKGFSFCAAFRAVACWQRAVASLAAACFCSVLIDLSLSMIKSLEASCPRDSHTTRAHTHAQLLARCSHRSAWFRGTQKLDLRAGRRFQGEDTSHCQQRSTFDQINRGPALCCRDQLLKQEGIAVSLLLQLCTQQQSRVTVSKPGVTPFAACPANTNSPLCIKRKAHILKFHSTLSNAPKACCIERKQGRQQLLVCDLEVCLYLPLFCR